MKNLRIPPLSTSSSSPDDDFKMKDLVVNGKDEGDESSFLPFLLATSSSSPRTTGATATTTTTTTTLGYSMDGPYIKYTVNDLFSFHNTAYLTYHCMGAGYDMLSPVGCVVGGIGLPYLSRFKHLTRLQAVGTGGIIGGTFGMGLGLLALVGISQSKNPKIPFNKDGIEQRVNGLKYNYTVRTLDLGVWLGIVGGAGGMLLYNGGFNNTTLSKLGLSGGKLGYLQAIGLASGAASVLSNIYVKMTK